MVGGRSRKHEVKVSEAEADALALRAAEVGISVPRLLVESALSPAGETVSERRVALVELFAVHRLLASVSNNVNQIARGVNATHQGPEAGVLDATLAAVRSTLERVDECVEGIGAVDRRGRR